MSPILLKVIGSAEIVLGTAILLLTIYMVVRFARLSRIKWSGIVAVVVFGVAILVQGILYQNSSIPMRNAFWTTSLTIVAVLALLFAMGARKNHSSQR